MSYCLSHFSTSLRWEPEMQGTYILEPYSCRLVWLIMFHLHVYPILTAFLGILFLLLLTFCCNCTLLNPLGFPWTCKVYFLTYRWLLQVYCGSCLCKFNGYSCGIFISREVCSFLSCYPMIMSLNLMHNTSMILSMKLSIKQGAKEVFYWKATVLCCVLGATALAAAAQVCIYRPGNPVPITLQSLAVLALSVVLGSHLGMGAVLLYLLGGNCGLSIFAGSSSGHHILLADKSSGYL